jgi:hypothetical protein
MAQKIVDVIARIRRNIATARQNQLRTGEFQPPMRAPTIPTTMTIESGWKKSVGFESTHRSSSGICRSRSLSAWLTKVELVVEAGPIRAGLLDEALREWRKLCSGNRSAGRVFCPSIMGVRYNLHVAGMALAIELECAFQGHAMNSFRIFHKFCKHHSTSYVINLKRIRLPDASAVCRVQMRWPELQ